MYNDLGKVTNVDNSEYANSNNNSVKSTEPLGSNYKEGNNVKGELAKLRANVSGTKALGVGNTITLVYYSYYMALANILTVEDL